MCARTGARLVLDSGEGGEYDALLRSAQPREPELVDEKDLLAINYTSGTTGSPKGVMYHHRGAFLQSLAMAFHTRLDSDSRYLWTLPMFHCDGWCFPWAVTAAGGTHVCLRAIDPAEVWRLLREEGVTHFSAAPTVLTMISGAPEADGAALTGRVAVTTGGAPPTPTLLARMAGLGMDVTHLYGLTETFGPVALNEWRTEWDELSGEERSTLRARQGVGNVIAPPLRVLDPAGHDVPPDGETIGEIAARGNVGDGGLLPRRGGDRRGRRGRLVPHRRPRGDAPRRVRRDPRPQQGHHHLRRREHLVGGGGAGARQPSRRGRVRGGRPPGRPVGRGPGGLRGAARRAPPPDRDAIVAHVRGRLAGFKAPKDVVFGELPKTSTGKIQKNVLRQGLRG